ncbi:VOC family protein [Ureibacillus sp. MALMAid1270]|uniref:VOC family protein n=1 Tax=Ureibacillus sp. MALMAid1270 TaxID=3411629 RepID=UPI003BA4554C
MENQVCVISIYVPNLNKAIDFYTNTLGFELNKHYGLKIATLVNGELPLVLEENDIATSKAKGFPPPIKHNLIDVLLNIYFLYVLNSFISSFFNYLVPLVNKRLLLLNNRLRLA